MGLINDYFGMIRKEPVKNIISIMPNKAITLIESGKLPVFTTENIMLKAGEACRYIDRAMLVNYKVSKKYQSNHLGRSYRITKNIRLNMGRRTTLPIENDIIEYIKGYLYITDKRIIFVAQKKAFEKNIESLTTIFPHSNEITFQFGNNVYQLIVADGGVVSNVISMIRRRIWPD